MLRHAFDIVSFFFGIVKDGNAVDGLKDGFEALAMLPTRTV